MMKMTLNEEIEYLQSGNWYDKLRVVLPTDEYLKLGWAIGDILETLELFRGLAPEPQTNADRIRAMSDAELAEQLTIQIDGVEACSLYLSAPVGKLFVSRGEAVRSTLEWLREFSEEE